MDFFNVNSATTSMASCLTTGTVTLIILILLSYFFQMNEISGNSPYMISKWSNMVKNLKPEDCSINPRFRHKLSNRAPPAVNLKLPPVRVGQGGVAMTKCSSARPSKPWPQTRAGEIGWWSSEAKCALERYGPYAKPMDGLAKQLGWPPEGF